ncbi:hypothetical protein [Sphingomonas sp.]|jgi:hypothetical protein|uniref:hypothetical protein n=1 Tax=Sphingomonas sp. TaxID=28214 RepID=UPI002EDAC357
MHEVSVDHGRRLVDVRLAGFFSPQTASVAAEEVRAAIGSLGNVPGEHVTLYDVSEVQIAPGPTIELLQETFRNPAYRHLLAKRVAFVTPSALARLQLQRVRQDREDIAIFDKRGAALDWLLA